jgi:caa(3)-type oxidase subunit IV
MDSQVQESGHGHAHAVDEGHVPAVAAPAAHLEPGGHAHPGAREYVTIAVILAVITAVEVATYYIKEQVGQVFAPILLVLSALKFGMVVLWFMHLRFDNRLFSILFVAGLALAGAVVMALIILFATSTAIIHI